MKKIYYEVEVRRGGLSNLIQRCNTKGQVNSFINYLLTEKDDVNIRIVKREAK